MESLHKKSFVWCLLCALLTFVLISSSSGKIYGQCSAPFASGQSGCPAQHTLAATSINSVTEHRWYTTPSGGSYVSRSLTTLSGGAVQSSYTDFFSSSVTYHVSAVCGGVESARTPVSFTSTSGTLAISASSDPMAVAAGTSVTLTATSGGVNLQWRYGNNTSGFIGISPVNVAKGGMYYASGNNNCGVAQSGSIQVNFLPVADAGPDLTVVGTGCTLYGGGSDQDGDAISFLWTKVSPATAVTMTGTTTSTLSVSGLPTTSLPQTFVFRLRVTDAHGKIHTDDANVFVTTSTNNNNYVLSETVKIPGQTTNAQVAALTVASKEMTFDYSDVLGRPLQTIKRQASPTGTDLIAGYEYDEVQRQKKSYLPVQQSQTTGILIGNLLGNGNYIGSTHYTVYNNGIAGVQPDAKAYSAVDFEPSPLGRVIRQGSIGVNFQPGENDLDLSYGTNTASDVRIWTISSNLPASSNAWEANLLHVVTSTNASGVQSQQITNRQGLKLLTRAKIDATNWAETYYVYDDRNNLRFVLPPELIRIIKPNGVFRNPTQAEIDAWASQYKYDNEGRVVETKDPGKASLDWSYAIYDKRDRVVLTQDPKQRLSNDWSYTKYDELNRPVISGIYRPGSAITRVTMQATIDALSTGQGYQNISPQTTAGVKAALDIVITAYEGINDYRAINSIVIKPGFTFTAGVTAASFQARIDDGSAGTSADAFPTVNDEPLVISFYDDYKQCGICQDVNFQFSTETWVGTSNEPFVKTDFVKDQVVAGSAKVLGSNQWLHSVSYYNRNGQPIQVTSPDHLGGRQRVSTLVDFSGRVLESLQNYIGLNVSVATVRRRFVYDNSNRLLKTYHRINSQPEVVLTAFEYNPVGQLIDKKIHSADNGSTYLQSIDYRYNIRGDILGINSTAGTDAGDPTDYFGMEFATNNTFGALNTARYDGLVNGIKWRTDLPDAAAKVKEKGYAFSYNNLGWLTGSIYKQNIFNEGTSWNQPQNTFFNEDGIIYDYNGNIQQLSRKTKTSPLTSAAIDQLQYNYGSPVGNKLLYVTDNASSPAVHKAKGFNDGSTSGNDYAYDVNGNVTMDKNKGITLITYNFQNLPDRITFADTAYIQYTYDVGGAKLRQVYYHAPTQSTIKTDYVNDLILLNDQLQFLFHEEGRIVSPDYNNMVPTPAREANGTEGYAANGSVAITSESINGQTYVKVVANQATGTPGVWPIGNTTYPVKPGESYSLKVLGYQTTGSTAKLYVSSTTSDIVWPGATLSQGASNESWVTTTFTIPAGVTQIKLGVLWQGAALGNTFYINRVALYKTDFEYQYFLSDQVGSPRVVLGTTPSILTYTATMETESFSNETTTFLNLNSAKYEVNIAANATPGGNEAIRMNNTYRVGPARSFKVFPGDLINASVQSYYTTASGLTKTATSVMASALSTVMSGGVQNIVDGINTAYNNPGGQTGLALSPFQGSAKPSAFINYILFDENYLPLEAKSQPIGAAGSRQQISLPQVSVKEAGYVFIYLSYDNESTHPVYFDDLKITYTESPVIQINNYYAFGLSSTEWVRDGETDNNFLFQGKELNDQTGLHDFHARQYDAALGRWFVMDPAGQFASPYNGMGNNPVMGTDPDGKFWHIVIGAAVGGVVNLGIKAYQGKIDSWGDGFAAFGIGAVAGAVGAATGGVAFTAAGGAAGGVGGFFAGAGGGVIGSAYGTTIQSMGNSIYFGDPALTAEQFGTSILIGGALGGTINGGIALYHGRGFLNGSLNTSNLSPANGTIKVTKIEFDKPKLNYEPKLDQSYVKGPLRNLPATTKPDGVIINKGDLAKYYPSNNGFAGQPTQTTLRAGQLVDRYGPETGSFLSPKGTPFQMRSLPSTGNLSTYQVIKPFPVQTGTTAPAFYQPGGGIQYQTPISIKELIRLGYLQQVK